MSIMSPPLSNMSLRGRGNLPDFTSQICVEAREPTSLKDMLESVGYSEMFYFYSHINTATLWLKVYPSTPTFYRGLLSFLYQQEQIWVNL